MGSRALFGSMTAVLLCSACKKDPPPPPAPAPAASASAAPVAAPAANDSGGVRRIEAGVKVGEELGYGVGIGGDRVAVSAFKRGIKPDDPEGDPPGSVFVYRLEGGRAVLETELKADKSIKLGNALAFDGSTLVVGALYDDGAAKATGAAYAFTRADSGWSKPSKLSARDGKEDDSFGIGVALAGKTIVIGNSRERGGSAYLFEPDKGGAIKPKQILPFPEPSGPAEAVAAHGDAIALGAQFGGKQSEQGAVHLFARGEPAFKADGVVTESDAAAEQHFGGAVAAGPRGIAAASEKQITFFERKSGKWAEASRLTPSITTGLADAALAYGDGVLVIGLPLVDEGRVLVYRQRDGAWALDKTLRAPDGKKEDWFGYAVAVSAKHVVVGAPLAQERAGAAYLADL